MNLSFKLFLFLFVVAVVPQVSAEPVNIGLVIGDAVNRWEHRHDFDEISLSYDISQRFEGKIDTQELFVIVSVVQRIISKIDASPMTPHSAKTSALEDMDTLIEQAKIDHKKHCLSSGEADIPEGAEGLADFGLFGDELWAAEAGCFSVVVDDKKPTKLFGLVRFLLLGSVLR